MKCWLKKNVGLKMLAQKNCCPKMLAQKMLPKIKFWPKKCFTAARKSMIHQKSVYCNKNVLPIADSKEFDDFHGNQQFDANLCIYQVWVSGVLLPKFGQI